MPRHSKQEKRIAIIGAGGQAREIAWLIRDINTARPQYDFLGYVVADPSKLGEHDSHENILGDDAWLEANWHSLDCLVIGVGDPAIRCKLAEQLTGKLPDIEWPCLIHPTAIYDKQTCHFERGVVISAGVTCTINITFGAFALINFGCTIGHEAKVGRGCVVNPGANISGGVCLEDGVLIGTGAQVLQYLRVGAGSAVGGGAVVVKDVEAGATVIGIPAKVPMRS